MDGHRRIRRPDRHRTPERVGAGEQGAAVDSSLDLHICPRCTSELVQPGTWTAVEPQRWHVELSCPDCGWFGAGVYSQRVLDRFDEVLDAGAAVLIRTLQDLSEENMRADLELFTAAIEADLILPEDF